MDMQPGELATHQQNLVSLFEVARSHHQQLTSFSILVILGTLGFTVTDAFQNVKMPRRRLLAVAIIVVELVIGYSLYGNAQFHNRILAEATRMDSAPLKAPNIQTILNDVGDTPEKLLFAIHVLAGIFAGMFMLRTVPQQDVALNSGAAATGGGVDPPKAASAPPCPPTADTNS